MLNKQHAILLLFPAVLLLCCKAQTTANNKQPNLSVSQSDTALHLINGILFYKDNKSFNGEVKELWPNGQIKSLKQMSDGKEQGFWKTFYPGGKPESIRWYNKGEKDSVHTGWWENGNKKYEYHFKNGIYEGSFTEWYQSGKMMQQVMYVGDKDVYGKGWRESGELYMNFITKNGRRYGINNSNLCYGLKNETVIK